MEIIAKCKYDYEAIKAMTHIGLYKRKNPKKQFLFHTLYCIGLIVTTIGLMIIWDSEDTMAVLLMVSIALLLLNCFMYIGFPKIQYKALSKAGEFDNEFIFGDKGIKVVSTSNGYEGEAEVEYSIISKVMETSKYIFIYQKNNQAYIIDKTKIIQGTVQDIKNRFLQFVAIKYIVCNY